MSRLAQSLLVSARIAELEREVDELARAAAPAPRVELPPGASGRRRLIAMLAHERRRNAKLVAELLR